MDRAQLVLGAHALFALVWFGIAALNATGGNLPGAAVNVVIGGAILGLGVLMSRRVGAR